LVLKPEEDAGASLTLRIRAVPKANPRKITDAFVDSLGGGAHSAHDPIQLSCLREQDASGELAHPEVASDERRQLRFAERLLVRRAQRSEVVEARGTLEERGVVGDHGAPFTGRDGLVDLQAVDADVTERAERFAPVAAAYALGAVLDDAEPVFSRNGDTPVHVGRITLKVSYQDDLRARRDPRHDVRRVEIE